MTGHAVNSIISWFKARTNNQKGWLYFATSFLITYLIYFILKSGFSLLYVIPLIFFVKAHIYWSCTPPEASIRPVFKKILFIMFILWIILLGIEFYLRILQKI